MIKTTILIIILIWLIPILFFLIAKFGNWNKAWSHIRWWSVIYWLGILSFTSFIVLPLAYLFRNFKYNPFWIYLDERVDESDYKVWSKDKPNNFITFYKWHTRNPVYNLRYRWKPKTGRINCYLNEEEIVEVVKDDLWRDGEKVNIYGTCLEMASIKWVDEFGNDGWQQNQGIKPSNKFSTWGTSEIWYEVDNTLYYRFSTARIVHLFFIPFYFQLKMGTNHERYILTLKLKFKS